MLVFLFNGTTASDSLVTTHDNIYTLRYPCSDSESCSSYSSVFPPGKYVIELYGGSGGHKTGFISTARNPSGAGCFGEENVHKYGGNTECVNINSMAGAGGYTSGFINLRQPTAIFINIGGSGTFSTCQSCTDMYELNTRPKGGFNGGAKGSAYKDISSIVNSGGSGGGGSSDIRIGSDDLWHRIIVAGGGGGSDNQNPAHGNRGGGDDGSGGAGGGLTAQGFWIGGTYINTHQANQTFGFSFGQGEASNSDKSNSPYGIQTGLQSSDRGGGGGGWFGGFSSHHGQGGAGGGSSFALTSDAIIPQGDITSHDEFYNNSISKPYYFSPSSEYIVHDVIFVQGIWSGDGLARITYFPRTISCNYLSKLFNFSMLIIVSLFILVNKY